MLKVADRTLEILEYMCSSNHNEFKLIDLCNKFNINKTIMHRTLRVLVERGYLNQMKKRGSYSVSLKLVELGTKILNKVNFIQELIPHMQSLSDEIGETINLGVLHDQNVVFIYKIDSPHLLKIDLRVGTYVPSYCTALGKAILAWLPKSRIEELFNNNEPFAQYTSNTIADFRSLVKELNDIKKIGYALDNEEYLPGILCIASPIFTQDGEVACAISVSGPSARIKNKEMQSIAQTLMRTVLKIRINHHL